MAHAPIVISGEAFSEPEVIAGWSLFKKLRKVAKKVSRLAKKVSPVHRLGLDKLVKRYGRKVLKVAAPALGAASVAMPWLAPAAVAANIASRVMDHARRGKKTARAAMRLLGRGAKRGDRSSRGMMAMMKHLSRRRRQRRGRGRRRPRISPRMNAGILRQLAALARRGNARAAGTLRTIAGAAEQGDARCQQLLEQAAGTARWDEHAYAQSQPYDITASNRSAHNTQVIAGQDWDVVGPAGPGPVSASPDYNVIAGQYDVVAGGPIWDFLRPHRPYRSDQEPSLWGARDAYHEGLQAVAARG